MCRLVVEVESEAQYRTMLRLLIRLTDVAGLSHEEAVKNMRWSASALFRGALSRHE